MKIKTPIYVTQPSLPPLEEFEDYLKQIWDNKILTNNGPFHRELEQKLCEYLGVPYISLFANGTLALLTALQALDISGEVITTPFSFVATSHAILWNKLKVVFADIEEETYTLDPTKIEAAITPDTSAILPVHVYGYPCRVKEIHDIASRHGLKVIYDAAHTFGTKLNGKSLCSFGDLSILSFHATKVFNTFEGGAIICHDAAMKEHIDHLKNFGFTSELTVEEMGINAKMSEIQAAFGLLQLKYIEEALEKRREIHDLYIKGLSDISGITLPPEPIGLTQNYSYFPIFINKVKDGKTRDEVYEELKRNNIYGRRYFYPLISKFPTYHGLESAQPGRMPVAEKITEEVICLPIYPDLDSKMVNTIIRVIIKIFDYYN
ncbi:MAG: DegT/DnrJ/EryC1/StrS family aminotransferase [Bacteroidales bacterium]|nr:DegT/DnrJ/EryC1/StrS family aminotransferase [Bacteroidales bacterium]